MLLSLTQVRALELIAKREGLRRKVGMSFWVDAFYKEGGCPAMPTVEVLVRHGLVAHQPADDIYTITAAGTAYLVAWAEKPLGAQP
jgi:hypothetical protein